MSEKNPGELKLEDQRRKAQQGRREKKKAGIGNLPGEKKKDFFIVIDDKYINDPKKFGMDEIVIMNPEKKAKGGRVGLKSGSKGCKLAMKGKGRAYGKNS